ncbi:MAG: CapA family protein [Coprococcus sp.]
MRFIVCGDALFSSRNLVQRLDKKLVNWLQDADGAFANAEFCTPEPETPPACGRGYMTSVRPATLDEFADLKIRMVGFVNNHTGDYGWQGVLDTMRAARNRNLIPCGIGRNLYEARLPQFLDTPSGRVGIVATSSTRSEVFAASNAGGGAAARPGSNPLRWGRAYVLPDELFEQLHQIDVALGTRESMDEGCRVETYPPQGQDSFRFGSLFEGCLQIERGDRAYVRTYVNEKDASEILKSIADAKKRSDLTVFSLHTHEGLNENWYAKQPPEFIEKMAHDAIDAGADVVVGHGAHFLRGVEIYHGCPIFYNIGSILMEFEAGESIIAPEMYESYGYDADCRPSDLHANRAKNKDGDFIGFNAERRFSENVLLQIDQVDGRMSYALMPIDLCMEAERPLSRGIPQIASPAVARKIAADMTDYSQPYGTELFYDEKDGMIHIVGI